MTPVDASVHHGSMTNDVREAQDALDELIELIDRIPGAARYRAEVTQLKDLLVSRRAPRIVVIGRRGHGKSSLANAILGAEKLAVGDVDQPAETNWQHLVVDGRSLDWLDTAGLDVAGREAERLRNIKAQVSIARPDVVLLACRAKDVDAAHSTFEQVAELMKLLKESGCEAPLLAAMTQVDELGFAHEKLLPYGDAKIAAMREPLEKLRENLARVQLHPTIVPVSAYMAFRGDELVFDGRYGLDRLSEEIFNSLPLAAQLEGARLLDRFRAARRSVAMKIVSLAASVAFGIGAIPIPVSDIIPLAALQLTVVTAIVFLSGRRLGMEVVRDFLGALGVTGGVAVAARELFRQLIKALPFAGEVVSGSVAAAGTYAVGGAAIAYFLDEKPMEEARELYMRMGRETWKRPGNVTTES